MKKWIWILMFLLVAGITTFLLIYLLVYNKPHPDYEKAKAEYSLQAQELYNEFEADPARAGTKYNGIVLEVAGAVSYTEILDSMVIAVFVFDSGIFGDEGIRCTMLPEFATRARDLQPGSAVIIKGFCAGYNDTDIVMEKCSFAETREE